LPAQDLDEEAMFTMTGQGPNRYTYLPTCMQAAFYKKEELIVGKIPHV